jgi:F420-0:gamma-glutamyl ligase
MTTVNMVDSLSAAAVMTMGESDECQPIALIENARVEYIREASREDLIVSPEEDMYLPLYQHCLK